jgi:hypothetical protein
MKISKRESEKGMTDDSQNLDIFVFVTQDVFINGIVDP